MPPQLPAIASYQGHLLNSSQGPQAAAIYYANFDSCWRAAAQHEAWDPRQNPHLHAAAMFGVDPSRDMPPSGFDELIYDAASALYEMQQEYHTQVQSLQALDDAIKAQVRQGELAPPVITNGPVFKLSSADVRLYSQASARAPIQASFEAPESIADIIASYPQAYTDYLWLCASASIILSIVEDSFIAMELGGKPSAADFVYY